MDGCKVSPFFANLTKIRTIKGISGQNVRRKTGIGSTYSLAAEDPARRAAVERPMLSFPSIFKRPGGGAPDAAQDDRGGSHADERDQPAAERPGPTDQ
jgi:hypothetical protein